MPKSMTFYWWKSCSQCRDMHNALTKGGASIAERDFFREPFTKEELRALIGDTPVRDFFSMKSPSIAKLGLTPESMSDDEMLTGLDAQGAAVAAAAHRSTGGPSSDPAAAQGCGRAAGLGVMGDAPAPAVGARLGYGRVDS